MRKILVTQAFSTSLPVEKVGKVGEEAGVQISHTETRFAGKGNWVNDFEAAGPPGKVAAFFERLNDLRRD